MSAFDPDEIPDKVVDPTALPEEMDDPTAQPDDMEVSVQFLPDATAEEAPSTEPSTTKDDEDGSAAAAAPAKAISNAPAHATKIGTPDVDDDLTDPPATKPIPAKPADVDPKAGAAKAPLTKTVDDTFTDLEKFTKKDKPAKKALPYIGKDAEPAAIPTAKPRFAEHGLGSQTKEDQTAGYGRGDAEVSEAQSNRFYKEFGLLRGLKLDGPPFALSNLGALDVIKKPNEPKHDKAGGVDFKVTTTSGINVASLVKQGYDESEVNLKLYDPCVPRSVSSAD